VGAKNGILKNQWGQLYLSPCILNQSKFIPLDILPVPSMNLNLSQRQEVFMIGWNKQEKLHLAFSTQFSHKCTSTIYIRTYLCVCVFVHQIYISHLYVIRVWTLHKTCSHSLTKSSMQLSLQLPTWINSNLHNSLSYTNPTILYRILYFSYYTWITVGIF